MNTLKNDLRICRIINLEVSFLDDQLSIIQDQMKQFTATEQMKGKPAYIRLVLLWNKNRKNLNRYMFVYDSAKERIEKRMY